MEKVLVVFCCSHFAPIISPLIWLWNGEGFGGFLLLSFCSHFASIIPLLIWLWNRFRGEGFGGILLLTLSHCWFDFEMALKETVWVGFCCSHFAPIISPLIWLWNGFRGEGFGGILLHSHSWVGAGLKANVMLSADSRDQILLKDV